MFKQKNLCIAFYSEYLIRIFNIYMASTVMQQNNL